MPRLSNLRRALASCIGCNERRAILKRWASFTSPGMNVHRGFNWLFGDQGSALAQPCTGATGAPTWNGNTMPSAPYNNIAFARVGALPFFFAGPSNNGGNSKGAWSNDGIAWTLAGASGITSGFGFAPGGGAIAVNPATGRMNAVSDATTDYVTSTDGGKTWSAGSGNNVGKAVFPHTFAGGAIQKFLVITAGTTALQSSGANFCAYSAEATALPSTAQAITWSGTNVVIATGVNCFRSSDLTTWNGPVAHGAGANGLDVMRSDGAGVVIGLAHDAAAFVYRSADDGATFTPISTNTINKTWRSIVFSTTNACIAVATDGTTIFSSDSGVTWAQQATTKTLATLNANKWQLASDGAGTFAAARDTLAAVTAGAYALCGV